MLEKIRNKEELDQTLLINRYQKNTNGTFGTVISYNKMTNTATVVITKQETNDVDEILTGVPCPTFIGVQMVAPESGRPCWVVFKNGDVTQPLITHFYNHLYASFDYPKQISSNNVIPTYLLR